MTSSSKTQTRKTDADAGYDVDGDDYDDEYYADDDGEAFFDDDDGEAVFDDDDGKVCMNLRVHLLKQSLGENPSEEKTKQTK